MTRRYLLIALISTSFALAGTAFAQKASTPKQPDKSAIANEHVKELILVMDTDKNGKISKQEWMTFMEAEFDRLDKNKNGELDPQEIAQSRIRVSQKSFSAVGK